MKGCTCNQLSANAASLTVKNLFQLVKTLGSRISLPLDDPGWEGLNLGVLALLIQIIKLHTDTRSLTIQLNT